jgi:purine nucleosidase
MGQTVIDWWGVTDRPANATVIRGGDDDAFFALLLDRIGRLP